MYNLAAELRFRDDDNELGYAAIGFEGSSYKEREDRIALTVAKEIIGSWNVISGKCNTYSIFGYSLLINKPFNLDIIFRWSKSQCTIYCTFCIQYRFMLHVQILFSSLGTVYQYLGLLFRL